jgi:hypothetical protein
MLIIKLSELSKFLNLINIPNYFVVSGRDKGELFFCFNIQKYTQEPFWNIFKFSKVAQYLVLNVRNVKNNVIY